MQDNAPTHASAYTRIYLEKVGITGEKLMIWPPASPDLNPIENFWSMVKSHMYSGNRQFSSKEQLWAAINEACSSISSYNIQNLTQSVDN